MVTNPPFSLFDEYVAQLVEHGKRFLIVGPKNAITYKEVFPLIKENRLWLGTGFAAGNAYFKVPLENARDFAEGVYDETTGLVKFRNVGWFTNLDHSKRHEEIPLFRRYNPEDYPKYDNFDAIEVGRVADIPVDYEGLMGVPITFLDKYNPEQFEIVANGDDRDEMEAMGVPRLGPEYVGNVGRRKLGIPSTKKAAFKRILIKRKQP